MTKMGQCENERYIFLNVRRSSSNIRINPHRASLTDYVLIGVGYMVILRNNADLVEALYDDEGGAEG